MKLALISMGVQKFARLAMTIAIIGAQLFISACSLFNQPILNQDELDKIQQRQLAAVQFRQDQLQAVSQWQLQGRISIVTNDEAWSGQLWWQQDANQYLIHFNAPNGQGALQLSGNEEGVVLKLSNGETFTSQSAEQLVLEQIGWRLPISHLWYWVRGLPEPQIPNRVTLGADGVIESIEQEKWKIEYERYSIYDTYQFPSKITMRNADMRLKVIVSHWSVS